MKRMWSKNELKNIADAQAAAVKKDIATLVDSQGHDRFIEGDINIEEIEGITKTYGKWSLSGSHLLIVLALSIDDALTIASNTKLADVNIPQWIIDKLVPVISSVLEYGAFESYASDYSSQTFYARLGKGADKLTITKNGALTMTKAREVRITYDFLIDSD